MLSTFTHPWEKFRKIWFERLYERRYFIILGFVYAAWKIYKLIYYRSEFLTRIGGQINDYLSLAYLKSLMVIARLSGESYSIGEVEKKNHLYYYIQLTGSEGVYIGWHCLAVPTMVIFTGTILLLRGSVVRKLAFILAGNMVIYLTNVFRIAGLMFMEKYSSGYFFKFNHSFTYLVITYAVVFLLIIYYMTRLEPPFRVQPSSA